MEKNIFKERKGEKRKKVVSEYLKEHIGDMFTVIEDVVIEKNIADKLTKGAENRDVVGNVDNQVDRKFFLKMFKKDGKRFVEIDGDVSGFDGLSEREQGALATKIIKEKFAGKVVGQDNKIFVNGRGAGEYGFPVKNLDMKGMPLKCGSLQNFIIFLTQGLILAMHRMATMDTYIMM